MNKISEEIISQDFEKLHMDLRNLEEEYCLKHSNLHFDLFKKADKELMEKLLVFAEKGLTIVQRHGEYFLSHSLYNDGMYWYDLFLLISSGVLKLNKDNKQDSISSIIVEELAYILIQIHEYSYVHPGDILKRNYEALGNLLFVFYSKGLVDFLQKKSKASNMKEQFDIVEYTIEKVHKM